MIKVKLFHARVDDGVEFPAVDEALKLRFSDIFVIAVTTRHGNVSKLAQSRLGRIRVQRDVGVQRSRAANGYALVVTEIDAHDVQFFRVFVSIIHRGAVPAVVFRGFNRNEIVQFRFKTRRRGFHVRIVARVFFL